MATVLVLLFKNSLSPMREFIKRRPCSTIVTNTGCHGYHCSLPQSFMVCKASRSLPAQPAVPEGRD